jgi:hypothetical protein
MELIAALYRNKGEKIVKSYIYERDESDKVVSFEMTLDDFVDALREEMESVTWVFTKAEFERRLNAAKNTVVMEMKKTILPYALKIPTDS